MMLMKALKLWHKDVKLTADELRRQTPMVGVLRYEDSQYAGRDGRGPRKALLMPADSNETTPLCELFSAKVTTLAELARIASGECVYSEDDVRDIGNTLVTEADVAAIRRQLDSPGPHSLAMVGTRPAIVVFGQEVELPPIKHVFDDVVGRIDRDTESFPESNAIPIAWAKGPGFKLTIEFELPALNA